ncbi:MAG: hypothetical protein ACXABM_09565, partial [Candidatus Thorarchaeota archaeon]
MRRAVVLPLLFILLFVSPIGDDSVSSTDAEPFTPSQGSLDIARNWSLNIVIVGYDHTKIDEAILLTGMPTERVYSAESVDITYNIDYNIEYTDASYYNDLQQVMLDNSENGTDTGTWLNQT